MGAASISSLDCLFAVSLSLAPQLGLGKIVPEKEEIRTTVPAARRGGPALKKWPSQSWMTRRPRFGRKPATGDLGTEMQVPGQPAARGICFPQRPGRGQRTGAGA
jgi:hypothetical protein